VSHLLLDLLELAPHAVTPGFPLEEELALTRTSADVGEAQEIGSSVESVGNVWLR
jgi:hypothetical protein